MGETDCIFCKIIAGEIPVNKVYEDNSVFAFLDIGPLSDGHTLVIPKVHCTKLHDCDADVMADLGRVIGKIAKAVVESVSVADYNVTCNNGKPAGQLVEHLHFHIIPRKQGDEIFKRWPAKEYEKGQAEKIAEEIRNRL